MIAWEWIWEQAGANLTRRKAMACLDVEGFPGDSKTDFKHIDFENSMKY
jgi:hypothetical protein